MLSYDKSLYLIVCSRNVKNYEEKFKFKMFKKAVII